MGESPEQLRTILKILTPKAVEVIEECETDGILMLNSAFGSTINELMALGAFIKLAGHHNKRVIIINKEDKDESNK